MSSTASKSKKATKTLAKPQSKTKAKAKPVSKISEKISSNGHPIKENKSKSAGIIVSSAKEPKISNVSLPKTAKSKLKPKEAITFKPRKIEKIIDVNRLEKKLEEIMAMDHSEFTVEEKLKALYVLDRKSVV